MCNYALFKRKNKQMDTFKGEGGKAGGQITKVWNLTWPQDSAGNRSGERLVHWREIVLVGTERLQDCAPL